MRAWLGSWLGLALGASMAATCGALPAHSQGTAAYVATYVEVMPNAVAAGAALLRQYRTASLKEDGNLRFDVLQELDRPNRFAITEAWRDSAALEGHSNGTATTQFLDKLKAIADAPPDQRINNGLYVGQGKSETTAGAIYVLTHVDVIPPGKDDCMAALKAMSTDTPNDQGNISYEVLQQTNRSNHFNVIEAWTSRKALEAHAMAAHTRAFRDKLKPIAGALYDERIYKALS
jgi:autoinducer 2-degrading protein